MALESGVASVTLTTVPAAPGSTIPRCAATSPPTKSCCCSPKPKGGCGGRKPCVRDYASRSDVAITGSRDAGRWPGRHPLFCDLQANLHLHLEHEVDIARVLDVKRTSTAAVMSIADAIEQALPALDAPVRSIPFLPPIRWQHRYGSLRTRRRG